MKIINFGKFTFRSKDLYLFSSIDNTITVNLKNGMILTDVFEDDDELEKMYKKLSNALKGDK